MNIVENSNAYCHRCGSLLYGGICPDCESDNFAEVTPGENLKWSRERLHLSVRQLQDVIDVNEKTIRMMESGRKPVPTSIERIMDWMLAGFRPPEFPVDTHR